MTVVLIGTYVRFTKEMVNCDGSVLAYKGQTGVIVNNKEVEGYREGYWVQAGRGPILIAKREEFEIVCP